VHDSPRKPPPNHIGSRQINSNRRYVSITHHTSSRQSPPTALSLCESKPCTNHPEFLVDSSTHLPCALSRPFLCHPWLMTSSQHSRKVDKTEPIGKLQITLLRTQGLATSVLCLAVHRTPTKRASAVGVGLSFPNRNGVVSFLGHPNPNFSAQNSSLVDDVLVSCYQTVRGAHTSSNPKSRFPILVAFNTPAQTEPLYPISHRDPPIVLYFSPPQTPHQPLCSGAPFRNAPRSPPEHWSPLPAKIRQRKFSPYSPSPAAPN